MAVATFAIAVALAATPPAPARWVEDQATFISASTRDALDARLEAYQRATGHQIIVWIGKSLEGAALDEWSVRTFEAWKIGRKGIDDGLAIFIFADDRKIDIEVGYGLEDKVPDAIASRIIREMMVPRIVAGDRDGAVTAGVDAVLAAIEGKPWTGPATTVEPQQPWIRWSIYAVLAVLALILMIKYPHLATWLLWAIVSSRWGGGSGDRRGFGGGGGRSGGGGARGGW
jgi:uncharacterized protein